MSEPTYGYNNLGISVSKAFLVRTTPNSTPIANKFRNVEKCRGGLRATSLSAFQSNRNCLLETTLMFDNEEFVDCIQPSAFEDDLSREFNKVNSQIMKFEAGLREFMNALSPPPYQANEVNYISTIYNNSATIVNEKCTCIENRNSNKNDDSSAMITFNVNMASTPKAHKVKSLLPCSKRKQTVIEDEVNCEECRRKKRKIEKQQKQQRQQKQKQKLHRHHKSDLIEIVNCNAGQLKRALKLKKASSGNRGVEERKQRVKLHDLTTSTKKMSTSFKKSIKRTIKEENFLKKQSRFGVVVDSMENNFCYALDAPNQFYQLGQLQVWYV